MHAHDVTIKSVSAHTCLVAFNTVKSVSAHQDGVHRHTPPPYLGKWGLGCLMPRAGSKTKPGCEARCVWDHTFVAVEGRCTVDATARQSMKHGCEQAVNLFI